MKIGIVAPSGATASGIGIYADQMSEVFKSVAQVARVEVTDRERFLPTGADLTIHKDAVHEYEDAAVWLNENCDVCLLHHDFTSYGWTDGGLALVLVARLTIPLVVVFHQVSAQASENRRRLAQAVGQCAVSAIVMSQQAGHVVEHLFKVPSEKIKVLPYGTPNHGNATRSELRKKLGFENRTVVVSAGLLRPKRSIEKILEAVAVVSHKTPEILFVHIGQTDGREKAERGESYRQRLLLLARQMKIADKVLFVDRYVPDALMLDYLKASDLCMVGNSDASTLQSRSLAMAMSAGAAILCSPFLQANEVMGDKMGEIYPFTDGQLLAQKIMNLLSHPKQLGLFRQATGDLGAHFQWDMVAPKYMSVLLEATGHNTDTAIGQLTNQMQLLVPIQSVGTSTAQSNVDNLIWSTIADASVVRFMGRALNNSVSQNPVVALCQQPFNCLNDGTREGHLAVIEQAKQLFALGCWLRYQIEHPYAEQGKVCFMKWQADIVPTGNQCADAFMVLALCSFLSVFPSEDAVLAQLKKLYLPHVAHLKQLQENQHHWPEENFGDMPALRVWALLEAAAYLGHQDVMEMAVEKANFVLGRMFDEGFLMTLSGREVNKTKIKRSELTQQGEEVLWAGHLCHFMVEKLDEKSLIEKAWQCYLWFLGENSVRQSLFEHTTGNCAAMISGNTLPKPIVETGSGNLIFTSMLAMAGDVLLRQMIAEE